MQAALAYARGEGTQPYEYRLRKLIETYGVAAIMNRNYLGVGEIRRMEAATNVIDGYKSRQASGNWAEWTAKHPELSKILTELEIEASGESG